MASLKDLGEFGFIDRIAQMVGTPSARVLVAMGDDCAVVETGGPEKLLITTDAAVEGRHFDLAWMTPFEAAQRTVAGAVSDIAAMGGRPFAALCTAGIPPSLGADVALEVMRGVTETLARYGAPLIGGDTVSGLDRIVVDLVVMGWAREPWLRSGASVGDRLLVTGDLGRSAAALELLLRDPSLLQAPDQAPLRQKMMDPVPRVHEAAALAPTGLVTAAIDISDGLIQDAGHMAKASGVRLELREEWVPVHPACPAKVSPSTSGEEYELLLAADAGSVDQLLSLVDREGLAPLTEIGVVTCGEGVALLGSDGSEIEVARGGWDHFRETT